MWAPRLASLAVGEHILKAAVRSEYDNDNIFVNSTWRIFKPLLVMSISDEAVHFVRNDHKPLQIVRFENPDSFYTSTHPVFAEPVEKLLMTRGNEVGKWIVGGLENATIVDAPGFTMFIDRVATAARHLQAS